MMRSGDTMTDIWKSDRPHRAVIHWTPEMDARVTAGLRAGLALREIARRLRLSPNAVIGRYYRLRGYVRPR